jgi:hypothetical protein
VAGGLGLLDQVGLLGQVRQLGLRGGRRLREVRDERQRRQRRQRRHRAQSAQRLGEAGRDGGRRLDGHLDGRLHRHRVDRRRLDRRLDRRRLDRRLDRPVASTAASTGVSATSGRAGSSSTSPASTSVRTTCAASSSDRPLLPASRLSELVPSTVHSSDQASPSRASVSGDVPAADSTGTASGPGRAEQRLPGGQVLGGVGEQVLDGHGRRDVLAGALLDPEAPAAGGEQQQLERRLAQLLADGGLDDVLLDEAEVDQQLAQAPALQLGGLRVVRLGQGGGVEVAGGDQAGPEAGAAVGAGRRRRRVRAQETLASGAAPTVTRRQPVADAAASAAGPRARRVRR